MVATGTDKTGVESKTYSLNILGQPGLNLTGSPKRGRGLWFWRIPEQLP
jgi:hypothetical protein